MLPQRAPLFATAALALVLAGGPATASADTAAAHNTIITCNEVSADGNSVSGTNCDTDRVGPIIDFSISDRLTGDTWHCAIGHAEGSRWVSGGGCQKRFGS
ncbi:hypothetical protein ACFQ08_07570 [Streptosporangium algeriense]|uniref:Secreted protein n=1 Tax=Streptosporangium algeriense TaxID=1682748 RepID=A0ABW3DKJ3_9ACTN